MTRQEILQLRLSLIFVKDKFTFFNSIQEFKNKLKERFSTDYTLDEVEDSLNYLEDKFVEAPETVLEVPEDFTF